MKKNIIIVIAGILILIMLSLFYTYAINVSMEQVDGNADLTYNINLSNPTSTIITVEPGETKYFDIVVTNTNDGAINYGLVYNQVEINTVTVAQTDVSKYKAIDSIEKDETRRISLVIKNDKTSNITYSILPVTGYEEGGDLIVPSNHTIIDDVYSYKSGTITGSVHDYVYVPGSGSGGSTGGDNPGGDSGGNNPGGDSGGGESGDTGTNLDTSNANSPDLVEGLIPVMYNGSKWVKASSTNSNSTYKWYDYNNKQWANAVLVSSSNRSTYKSAAVGTEIPESDVLAYYVWIPRYKYKVFNINKVVGTDSYNAKSTGVDITFESETATTGTIKCTAYDHNELTSGLSETCSGSNGSYYTHPAFWWDQDGDTVREAGEELRGIWVGKFSISSSTPTAESGGGETTDLAVRTKPNVNPWQENLVTNFYLVIKNMSLTNNEYGLSTDSDSHMLKNTQWGAVVYLSHSDYGICSNNSCATPQINAYYDESTYNFKTGCGPITSGETTVGTTCNAYTTTLGQLASTTGNVYGIYDMSGGVNTYVMGQASYNRSATFQYLSMNGGDNFAYSASTAKYIDTYAFAQGSQEYDQIGYNRSRLGDATGEVTETEGASWFTSFANFPAFTNLLFVRGGYYQPEFSQVGNIFYFSVADGDSSIMLSARAALIKNL